jgi:hypothetical protein
MPPAHSFLWDPGTPVSTRGPVKLPGCCGHPFGPVFLLLGSVACLDPQGIPGTGERSSYPSYIALEVGESYPIDTSGPGARAGLAVLPEGIARISVSRAGSSLEILGLRPGFAEWIPLTARHPVWIAVLGAHRSLPVLIGHRGVPSLAPENTLAGVEVACGLGLPGVEVDVRFTADSIPVLMHDRDVRRTSNGTGNVDELTLTQLRTLDVGSWFGSEFAGERIPTLHEFLVASATCSFEHVELDVKTFLPLGVDSGATRIAREVTGTGLLNHVLFAADLNSLRQASVVIAGMQTLVYGGVISESYADALIQARVNALSVQYDDYLQSTQALARLESAGLMVGVWGPRSVLDLNSLTPVPKAVTSDWAWAVIP